MRHFIQITYDPKTGKRTLNVNLEWVFIPLQVIIILLKLTGKTQYSWVKVFWPTYFMVGWILFFFILTRIILGLIRRSDPWVQLNRLVNSPKNNSNNKKEQDNDKDSGNTSS